MDSTRFWAPRGTTRRAKPSTRGARLLGLPYPGGPNVAKLALEGDPRRVLFPRSLLGDSLDFSFSGVKTSLRAFVTKDAGQTPLPRHCRRVSGRYRRRAGGKDAPRRQTNGHPYPVRGGRRGGEPQSPGRNAGYVRPGSIAPCLARTRSLHRQCRHDRLCRVLPTPAARPQRA